MDDADWRDIMGLLDEWNQNPPIELFARAYFKYEPQRAQAAPGDKFFGDEDLPAGAKTSGAPPLSEAPPEVQAIFDHFLKTRTKTVA